MLTISRTGTESQAAIRRCSEKFRIIHRKTPVLNLFSIKLQAWKPATLLTIDSGTDVFLRILQNFSEHLFHRTPPDDCFLI